MGWIENTLIILLFMVLLIIIAQIIIDKNNIYKKSKKEKTVFETDTAQKIKQLKNEINKSLQNDTDSKEPVLDILVKHKKADKVLSKSKPHFSLETPLKLEELQEELDLSKKDIMEEEVDDVEDNNKKNKFNEKERKIEDLIQKNIDSNDIILNKNQYFKLGDGRFLKNISELVFAIEQMAHQEFERHVNNHNNDFANWIEHVFKNKELANELRKDTSKRHILQVLKKELN